MWRLVPLLVLVSAAVGGQAARASEIVDRNATNVTLLANGRGEALVSYRVGGRAKRVLLSGAVDAVHPKPSGKQVGFRFRYGYPGRFSGSCGRYDGPSLPWLVVACKAADGSYWAAQAWQRML